jgi:hypothetical protein
VVDTGCDWLVDGFVVGDVTEDGTQQRMPLTDAWAVRFEAMARRRTPAARDKLENGSSYT